MSPLPLLNTSTKPGMFAGVLFDRIGICRPKDMVCPHKTDKKVYRHSLLLSAHYLVVCTHTIHTFCTYFKEIVLQLVHLTNIFWAKKRGCIFQPVFLWEFTTFYVVNSHSFLTKLGNLSLLIIYYFMLDYFSMGLPKLTCHWLILE